MDGLKSTYVPGHRGLLQLAWQGKLLFIHGYTNTPVQAGVSTAARRPSGVGDFSARRPAVYRSTEAGKERAEACDGGLVAASEEGERAVAGADTAAGANGVAAQRARAFQEGLAGSGLR